MRELENSIKRALVLSSGEVLTPEDFAFLVAAPAGASGARRPAAAWSSARSPPRSKRARSDVYRKILERVEQPLLEAVLAHTDGNQIRAAAILGINRNTLRKKIVELGIALPGRR